jgi:hypothetical protein
MRARPLKVARRGIVALLTGALAARRSVALAQAESLPGWMRHDWPRTDFSRITVSASEITAGGPPRDGIPAIDQPRFHAAKDAQTMSPGEPVITLDIASDARAYPLRILLWHEIVNDVVADVPVTVTYCPLCNASIVFDRRTQSGVLDFGVTGLLRHSDMIMYDRQTESWWQQFTGEAIAGALTGMRLQVLPARVESLARFAQRFPAGRILAPDPASRRPYGRNPYVGYDTEYWPFLFKGDYSGPPPALSRVVSVGADAWPLDLLRQKGRIAHGDLVLTWEAGQTSPLDTEETAKGRDIGNVVVQRQTLVGLVDVAYDIPFAFAFKALRPDGRIHLD